jgi:hypothetical protein
MSRFPPPWTVEEYRGISYIVRDANRFAVCVCLLRVEAGPARGGEPYDQG